MTNFVAYFDDSGSEGLGPVFVLAGYVAPAEAWQRFSIDWRAIMDEAPTISYFKMREANSLRGEFFGWQVEARDRKIDRLAAVIKQYVSFGVTSTLFWDDFRAVAAESTRLRLIPYDILYHGTMSSTAQFVRRKFSHGDTVAFIFDEQEGLGEQAASAFNYVRELLTHEEKLVVAGSPLQGNDRVLLPLQTADMIAWQTRRFVYENPPATGMEPLDSYVVNSPVLKKLETVTTVYNTYGIERLRGLVADFDLLKSIFPDKDLFRAQYSRALNDRWSPLRMKRSPKPWEKG